MAGKQYFSYDKSSREILFLGRPLLEDDIERIRQVRKRHVIPHLAERYLYESIIFSIANQRINYERSLAFMKMVHTLTDEQLKDPGLVHKLALEGESRLMWKENRFEPFYDYAEKNGGISKIVQEYLDNPQDVRQELDDVKWIGLKTASLLYICIGGNDGIVTLDVHNTRQTAGLGIEIPERYYVPRKRKSGRKGRNDFWQISGKDYVRAEADLIDMVSQSTLAENPAALNPHGNIDGSFISALLWWPSTIHARNGSFHQLSLFPESGFFSPYSTDHKGDV